MQAYYFDNAATSYPKAPEVGNAMGYYVQQVGANVNRADYEQATAAAVTLLSLRERLCRLFHFEHVQCAVVTPGMTYALNQVLKGYLRPGDHVLVSSLEHNAVLRPLAQLAEAGVSVSRIPCGQDGLMDPEDAQRLIRPNTRLACVIHASNVCGSILPVQELGNIFHRHGIPFVLDAAQTAGHLDINFEALHLSALCVPGHKGLLGPSGIGAMLLAPAFAQALTPLVAGGTGSNSDSEAPPDFFPDRLEAGTMNLPGVYGLERALAYLEEQGIARLHARAMDCCARFLQGIAHLPGVRAVGPAQLQDRVAVASLDFLRQDNAAAAFALESDYNIHVRCGLHCAPSAHRTLGTYPQGTVRFSFGCFNTPEQVDHAIAAIRRIA